MIGVLQFSKVVCVALDEQELQEARRRVNLAIFGHENCNILDRDGLFVSHPDLSLEVEHKLLEAHYRLSRTVEFGVVVTVSCYTGNMVVSME